MNYEEMSDFEVNSAVHNLVRGLGYTLEFLGGGRIKWSGDGKVIITDRCAYSKSGLRDYCNNPSDAWPIVFDNEISLVNVDDALWVARFGIVYSEGVNPLRAAMIVFLMMKDAECQKR